MAKNCVARSNTFIFFINRSWVAHRPASVALTVLTIERGTKTKVNRRTIASWCTSVVRLLSFAATVNLHRGFDWSLGDINSDLALYRSISTYLDMKWTENLCRHHGQVRAHSTPLRRWWWGMCTNTRAASSNLDSLLIVSSPFSVKRKIHYYWLLANQR